LAVSDDVDVVDSDMKSLWIDWDEEEDAIVSDRPSWGKAGIPTRSWTVWLLSEPERDNMPWNRH